VIRPAACSISAFAPTRLLAFFHRKARREAPSPLGREAGTAAVEFAILAPLLVLLLCGIVVYGGYFMLSHSLQQLANDAARAALAGLSDTERRQLATTCLSNELPTYGFLDPKLVQLAYADQSQVMTVNIAYDATNSPFWALDGVIPMPPASIVRSASVQIGGF
jgi:Flp pilus assembly protein TadG